MIEIALPEEMSLPSRDSENTSVTKALESNREPINGIMTMICISWPEQDRIPTLSSFCLVKDEEGRKNNDDDKKGPLNKHSCFRYTFHRPFFLWTPFMRDKKSAEQENLFRRIPVEDRNQ